MVTILAMATLKSAGTRERQIRLQLTLENRALPPGG
jgi:hypothetical protein